MSDKEKKRGVPDEWKEPSQRAFDEVNEAVGDFTKELEESGPSSDYEARDRVVFRGEDPRFRGRKGTVVGHSFVAPEESCNAGEVCRGVAMDSGAVVTVSQRNLKRARGVSVSLSGISQEKWDAIFGSKKKRKPS